MSCALKSAVLTLEGLEPPARKMETTSSPNAAQWERDLPPTPTSPAPSSSEQQNAFIPPWMRDMSAPSTTRQSRASSIISTRTRFSTTTIQEDARSIDIQVGGQNFRISRDGSGIRSEAPPPYSASEIRSGSPILEEVPSYQYPMDGAATGDDLTRSAPPNTQNRADGLGPRVARPAVLTSLRANILDPSEVDIPSPVDDADAQDAETPPSTPRVNSRGLTRPQYNDEGSAGASKRTVSREGLSGSRSPVWNTGSAMSNGERMRLSTLLASQGKGWQTSVGEPARVSTGPLVTSAGSLQSRSTDAALPGMELLEGIPQSPHSIGKKARGISPSLQPLNATREEGLPADSPRSQTDISRHIGGDDIQDGTDERISAPGVDSENEVSLHYTRMIRFIDREHRRALHAKDKELAELRERLHEVDTVYRQELRAKDFIIDDLKQSLHHLEDSMEIRLEKARNEVEDVWESRWKDRDFQLRERMQRIESEASIDLERSREHFGVRQEPAGDRDSVSISGSLLEIEAQVDHDQRKGPKKETKAGKRKARKGLKSAPNPERPEINKEMKTTVKAEMQDN